MDCIICQLVNEEIEVTKVYEDDFVVAVMDIQPINSGHLQFTRFQESINF